MKPPIHTAQDSPGFGTLMKGSREFTICFYSVVKY